MSPLPCRDSARSVQVPGAAKNRNCPAGEVTTSAVNSPVESSSRTYAPGHGLADADRTTPVMTVSFSRSRLAGSGAAWSGAAQPAAVGSASSAQASPGSSPSATGTPTSEPYSVQEPS